MRLREPLISCSALTLCCFCLVSSLVAKEQLTLDGLVCCPPFVACHRGDRGLRAGSAERRAVCTLYLVFKEPSRERLLFPCFLCRGCDRDRRQANLPRLRRFRTPCQQKLSSFFVGRPAQKHSSRTFAEQEPQAVTSEQAFRAGTSSTGRDDVSD